MNLDDALDALYAADPGAFVETRGRLARELKADGDAEAARQVKARRKPPLAIWAVNQLSRRHPDQVKDLLAAGQALRKAQRKALSGVKAAGLREATQQRARAADALTGRAEKILAEQGAAPAAHLPAVHTALVAAAADEAVAGALERGRLEDVPEPPSGFGDASILSLVRDAEEPPAADPGTGTGKAASRSKPEHANAKTAKGKAAKPKAPKAKPAGPSAAERRALKAAREKAREAAAASADQAGQVREAEAALRDAERDARDAERRARKAQRAADQARRRLERARSDAKRLDAASRRAARELSGLQEGD